jgi:cellulose synthase (UDP-forming)
MPLSNFWPQLALATVAFAAVVWGCLRIYYERENPAALAVNMFWCVYHIAILGMTLYFNFPEEQPEGSTA